MLVKTKSNIVKRWCGIYNGGALTITNSTISDNVNIVCAGICITSEDNVIIGGDSDTDFDNFNNFSGVPLGQYICKYDYEIEATPTTDPMIFTIDCHASYPNNYFDPSP